MAKKLDALQLIANFYIEKWNENYRKNNYRGLGLLYSGLLAIGKKYSGIEDTKEFIEKINPILEKKGFSIVPDKRARIKLVKLSKSETIKKELEEEFLKFVKDVAKED